MWARYCYKLAAFKHIKITMVLWLLKKISMELFMGKMLQTIYFKQFNKICRKIDKAKKYQ